MIFETALWNPKNDSDCSVQQVILRLAETKHDRKMSSASVGYNHLCRTLHKKLLRMVGLIGRLQAVSLAW